MMPGYCMINMLAGSSAFNATHEDRRGRAKAGQRTEVPLLERSFTEAHPISATWAPAATEVSPKAIKQRGN